jgi:NAD-dependent dihydropyrimidine dehydrogenase PreA subunit
MATVVTDACIKDYLCIAVCQRKCIHPRKDEEGADLVPQVYINPKKCLDCGSCIEVCESGALFTLDELPEDKQQFAEINAAYYRKN